MPEISRFLGLIIRMYFYDHEPPHFHVYYGSDSVLVRILPVGLLSGSIPPRVLALAVEWATLHEVELLLNWQRLRQHQPPVRIAPLE